MNTEKNITKKASAPETSEDITETGEGLKGVSWKHYWELKAHAEALAEALLVAQVRLFMLDGHSDEYVKIGEVLDAYERGRK
jgi:hypothetical protein